MKQNCIAILLLTTLFSICANAQDQPSPQPQQPQSLQVVPQAPVTSSSEASYVGPPPSLNKTPMQNAPKPKPNQPTFIDAGGNLKMINGSNGNAQSRTMPPPSTPIIVPEQSPEVEQSLPIQPEPGLPTPTPSSAPAPTSIPMPQPTSVEPQPTPTPMPQPTPTTPNAPETPTQIIPEGPGVPTPPPLPGTVAPQSLPTPPTNPMPSGGSY